MIRFIANSIFYIFVNFQITSWVCLLAPLMGQTSIRELVNIKDILPDIELDLKYATTDNFTGQKLYTTDECYLALGAINQLQLIQDSLRKIHLHNGINYPDGLGVKVWDGYRPRSVQYLMWEIVPDPQYVADPATGSSHNRGGAIDLTLIDFATKEELELPTAFDHFGEEAHHSYTNLPEHVIANRELLRNLMTELGGFSLYSAEWWHYKYVPSNEFPLLDFQLK
tara:strand:- start:66 stop:740 length:675 start_codon:yes stop_codon:yes gene_type:complete